jgi:hypothetical protein
VISTLELIQEVESICGTYRASIERNKKYFDYPFTSNSDHYYKLMLLHTRLDTWERVAQLLSRYNRDRLGAIEKARSDEFKKIIDIQLKGCPGFITERTRNEMIEYMKKLEWRIDELEDNLLKASIK